MSGLTLGLGIGLRLKSGLGLESGNEGLQINDHYTVMHTYYQSYYLCHKTGEGGSGQGQIVLLYL